MRDCPDKAEAISYELEPENKRRKLGVRPGPGAIQMRESAGQMRIRYAYANPLCGFGVVLHFLHGELDAATLVDIKADHLHILAFLEVIADILHPLFSDL